MILSGAGALYGELPHPDAAVGPAVLLKPTKRRRRFMKRLLMLMAVGVMIAGEAQAQEPIRIGAMYPLTGGGAIYGVPALAGHQLAIEKINRRGGIMGRKVSGYIAPMRIG